MNSLGNTRSPQSEHYKSWWTSMKLTLAIAFLLVCHSLLLHEPANWSHPQNIRHKGSWNTTYQPHLIQTLIAN
jgi:asparagine N-glycosylation enzyme membrane subunit Stt3